ncbi:16S rRNA (cytidine(1402)-2'-O)-methyltransferase [Hyphobacterium sp. HN65]|uniref:Ribosomal RNA small subunit methyltransferase I n=1 Tax=Hyphobacterium lacteum TaxID=3116575 RepID=A0ABU7LRY5_9PROT|nr:16S rRNA (cytidine(1402)-2'-O)-methyltransferase [Hyphobacterium sp. HN65]MEE2526669.1 16S rRNA (cytidine(1402)-2'-O)-methyltransferase [Hyphobacterium sp. HN65]
MSEPPSHIPGEASRRAPAPQPPEPGLNIVSTPIGNLRDITLRALDALAGADRIYAEDTRIAARLLDAYGISARVLPYHDHNGAKMRPGILEALAAGERVVLISDAGTPLISDPGYKLVREAVEAGHPVRALPGASALLTGLAAAGLPSDAFFFAGFLPPKSGARRNRLSELATVPGTLVFYETGPRIAACLVDVAAALGNRDVVVARELTKKFEEYRRGPASEIARHYEEAGAPRGEITLIVAPPGEPSASDVDVDAELAALIPSEGVKGAASLLAQQTGLNKRDLYARAQAIKDGKA